MQLVSQRRCQKIEPCNSSLSCNHVITPYIAWQFKCLLCFLGRFAACKTLVSNDYGNDKTPSRTLHTTSQERSGDQGLQRIWSPLNNKWACFCCWLKKHFSIFLKFWQPTSSSPSFKRTLSTKLLCLKGRVLFLKELWWVPRRWGRETFVGIKWVDES